MVEPLLEGDLQATTEKLRAATAKLQVLRSELSARELPNETEERINAYIRQVNASPATGDTLAREMEKACRNILKLLEKELELVPRNHYRNQWMALGMAAFGLPFGVVYAVALNNYGLLGLGLPIGMAVGLGIGTSTSLDRKAAVGGRQLALE
ncbi:hypothetical protein [Pontibacter litorisediminis]|uniref:hypothetical protein n=1 Tax=Pontibacter litorisediminis TaxID=1846260 RepID=UPI0023ED2605|nr:hypothetical protein [Pontibacter litorisediminis]